MPKPLTIYKASAGSGKTFTLALEYIKLLMRDPENYRHTLAVTFTNKATEEMKTRILGKLYAIAHSLPDGDDYMDKLHVDFPNMTDTLLRSRANDALQSLIHHYHYFRVETIDSFFQSVLRNLARELGLAANLSVGLNSTEVESQAVDNIIASIDNTEDPLFKWIMAFVNDKIQGDKSWDVVTDIKELGKDIFSEFYKAHEQSMSGLMADPKFFSAYKQRLIAYREKEQAAAAHYAQRFQAIADEEGLDNKCFFQGSKSASAYFNNLAEGKLNAPNSYVAPALDNPEALAGKKATPQQVQAIATRVVPLIIEAEKQRKRTIAVKASVGLTLSNFSQLCLLGRIQQEVDAINDATGNFLLCDTQQMLHSLISGNDSPFIYEKIGSQLHYIMIDEFQDTSRVQWDNFKVLLADCIAHANGSLIVGDVKQSIYRWRNGDWRLLHDLSQHHDTLVSHDTECMDVKPLGVNYRSQRNIIYFNNAFFTIAKEVAKRQAEEELTANGATDTIMNEAEDIANAYGDVCQDVPKKRTQTGLVSFSLLPDDNYNDMTMQQVRATLENLLNAGTPPEKIAILVRVNKDITRLAEWFQQNPITVDGKQMMVPMVSDEAFRLDASLAVNTIVTAMHVLATPDDSLALAMLVKVYRNIQADSTTPLPDAPLFIADPPISVANDNDMQTDTAGQPQDVSDSAPDNPTTMSPERYNAAKKTAQCARLRKLLPPDMHQHWDELLAMPLTDLAERLYRNFCLSRLSGQSAYICAFFDQMARYLQRHAASLSDFLNEWEEHLCSKTIHSDANGGVRLLSIHKSKGLEFDHVIIPWADWTLEKTGSTLWVDPSEAGDPFSTLPIAPLPLTVKELLKSVYKDHYQSEHIKNIIDNLNVLYVAFTRASRNLYIISRQKTKVDDKGTEKAKWPAQLFADTLPALCNPASEVCSDTLHGCMTVSTDPDNGTLTYTYGEFCPSVHEEEKTTDNIFTQNETPLPISIRNFETKAHFVQSYDSAQFILSPNERLAAEKQQTYIDKGNILHSLFASIYTLSDLDQAIDQLQFSGVLTNKSLSADELRQTIYARLQSPEVRQWFAPHWTVFNECTILTYDPESQCIVEKRPDRVIYDGQQMIVIDFKTGAERPEHHQQVGLYMALLQHMGYDNVSGFLWYIPTNHVLPVNAGSK